MGNMIITTPLSGTVCRRWTGTSYDQVVTTLCNKFEISTLTHCEDMKGDKKCRNLGGLGVVTQGHRQYTYSIEHVNSYSILIETLCLSCTIFELYRLFPKI